MSPKAMQAMKPLDNVVSTNGLVSPKALQAMKQLDNVVSKNGPEDTIPTKTERKKKKKIPAALQGIASTSHEAARPCTRHEAAVTSTPTAMQVKKAADKVFEAITTATTPKRKKVKRALLQGIASASHEAARPCTSHEAATKRLRQDFWRSIFPRWVELKQTAIRAGKQPPDFSWWCNERARMQGVPDVWKDWS